jgi:hypothetical protein
MALALGKRTIVAGQKSFVDALIHSAELFHAPATPLRRRCNFCRVAPDLFAVAVALLILMADLKSLMSSQDERYVDLLRQGILARPGALVTLISKKALTMLESARSLTAGEGDASSAEELTRVVEKLTEELGGKKQVLLFVEGDDCRRRFWSELRDAISRSRDLQLVFHVAPLDESEADLTFQSRSRK